MQRGLKFSVITANVGQLGDRFCPSGYNGRNTFEEKLKEISKIKDIKGIELCYNIDGDESEVVEVKALLGKYGLIPSVVNVPLNSDRKWRFGTLSSMDKKVRDEAIEVVKNTIDFTAGIGCDIINLWLGQDGFDYSFQVDYLKQWNNQVEAVRSLADHNPDIKIALEFKPREPRNRCLMDSASTTLLLAQDIGRDNVGITVDVGHVLQNKQNMAQVVEIVNKYGRLFNLHMNDNYADWDDDMIVGSVHLIEYIELFYSLRKMNYCGWCSVDIFPFREDGFRAVEESVSYMKKFDELVDIIGYEVLTGGIEKSNVTGLLKLIREKVFR